MLACHRCCKRALKAAVLSTMVICSACIQLSPVSIPKPKKKGGAPVATGNTKGIISKCFYGYELRQPKVR